MQYDKGSFCTVPIKALRGLHPYAQVLYMWLCHHANQDGICFPSLSTLAAETALSKDSVIKYTKELIENGLLKKEAQKNGEEYRSNIYQLLIIEDGESTKLTQEVVAVADQGVVAENDNPSRCERLGSRCDRQPLVAVGDQVVAETVTNYNHITKTILTKPIEQITTHTQEKPVEEKSTKKVHNKKRVENEQVKDIFAEWQIVMNHPSAILDNKRRRNIEAAIRLGYTTEQLKQAIAGCKLSPWYMGKNDRGEIFDEVHIIFKSAANIDRFIDNFKNPKQGDNNAKLSNHERKTRAIVEQARQAMEDCNNHRSP